MRNSSTTRVWIVVHLTSSYFAHTCLLHVTVVPNAWIFCHVRLLPICFWEFDYKYLSWSYGTCTKFELVRRLFVTKCDCSIRVIVPTCTRSSKAKLSLLCDCPVPGNNYFLCTYIVGECQVPCEIASLFGYQLWDLFCSCCYATLAMPFNTHWTSRTVLTIHGGRGQFVLLLFPCGINVKIIIWNLIITSTPNVA